MIRSCLIFFITMQILFCRINDYGEKQITIMLNNYFKTEDSISILLGHHFYKEQEDMIFQIEIQTKIDKINNAMIDAFLVINKLSNISKIKFTQSIVIIHFEKNFLPVIAKSNLDCSKNYFINNSHTEAQWRKNCLSIQNK